MSMNVAEIESAIEKLPPNEVSKLSEWFTEFEAEVWDDPEVLRRMKEDFVLISLYVDESSELPEAEQYTNAKGEKITTLGEKNIDYEVTKFGFNAQPLYMFLDLNGKPLSDVKYGYDPNIQKFINHLQTVKTAFEKRK